MKLEIIYKKHSLKLDSGKDSVTLVSVRESAILIMQEFISKINDVDKK